MNPLQRSTLLPVLASLVACGPSTGMSPTQRAAAPSTTAEAVEASSNEPPIPVPEMPVGPPFVAAPTPDPAAPSLTVSMQPDLDCATFKGGPGPSQRFLCEFAMGKRPASSLVDARGYAYVAYYGNASDEGPSEWKVRRRRCGAEAVANLDALRDEIRMKLGYVENDPWVSCTGLVCDVRAEGEWSTPQRLYFRQSVKGPVLEAWTQIEVSLIPPERAAARQSWINQGRWALSTKGCGS